MGPTRWLLANAKDHWIQRIPCSWRPWEEILFVFSCEDKARLVLDFDAIRLKTDPSQLGYPVPHSQQEFLDRLCGLRPCGVQYYMIDARQESPIPNLYSVNRFLKAVERGDSDPDAAAREW